MDSIKKDPQAVLDYGFDWSASGWLATGETISTSNWTVEAGITKDSDTNDNTTTTIWLSGGTAGEDYTVTNTIVTSASRTDERSIIVAVRER